MPFDPDSLDDAELLCEAFGFPDESKTAEAVSAIRSKAYMEPDNAEAQAFNTVLTLAVRHAAREMEGKR